MNNTHHKFDIAAKKIAFDTSHRNTIRFNIARYDTAVAKGMARYENVELAKTQAAAIKREALANWGEYLLEFESKILKRGVQVLWAEDDVEATDYIKEIITRHDGKLLVKSKSMTTEEVELNDIAESMGCESVETDLGEFIVQVAGEKPYHIVTPAMHKSKGDIAKLFNEKFDTPIDSTPEEMTEYVRNVLRKKYTESSYRNCRN